MAPLVPLPMMVISNSPINTAQVFHQENFPHALMRNSVYYVFPPPYLPIILSLAVMVMKMTQTPDEVYIYTCYMVAELCTDFHSHVLRLRYTVCS